MGCIKLSILDEQYKTGIRLSSFAEELTPIFCAKTERRDIVVKYIDPDGKDIWEINEYGHVVNHTKDKTQDKFVMVNKGGSPTGASLTFKYGTVTGWKKQNSFRTATSFSLATNSAGAELFKFFADNKNNFQNIEYGLITTFEKGGKGGSTVMTNHKSKEVFATAFAVKMRNEGKVITSVTHNHWNNSDPSGFEAGDTGGDKFAAGALPSEVSRYVYKPDRNSLIQYDKDKIGDTKSWNDVWLPSTRKTGNTQRK